VEALVWQLMAPDPGSSAGDGQHAAGRLPAADGRLPAGCWLKYPELL